MSDFSGRIIGYRTPDHKRLYPDPANIPTFADEIADAEMAAYMAKYVKLSAKADKAHKRLQAAFEERQKNDPRSKAAHTAATKAARVLAKIQASPEFIEAHALWDTMRYDANYDDHPVLAKEHAARIANQEAEIALHEFQWGPFAAFCTDLPQYKGYWKLHMDARGMAEEYNDMFYRLQRDVAGRKQEARKAAWKAACETKGDKEKP